MSDDALRALRHEMHEELIRRILPFWMHEAADLRHGGVVGLVSEDGQADDEAPKGCILHARTLWAMSAAHRVLGDDVYRDAADRSATHFSRCFVDATHGGVFWMIDAEGRPLDDRKHVYAQAFAIYALAEHFRATGDRRSLDAAIALFALVEAHAHDPEHGGYEEAFTRDWTLLDDVRLSDVDVNERRSANTHLHLVEAYTTLHRAWPDDRLRVRLASLIELFLEHLVAADGSHVVGFLSESWEPRSRKISFGHDIETSWLLVDAAHALGDAALIVRVQEAATRLAESVLRNGVDRADGGIYDGSLDGQVDTDKEWWQQTEAIVGFVTEHLRTGHPSFLHAATGTWSFVKAHLLDHRHGEWRRRVSRDGTESRGLEKVGPWKCPYHNTRACLEIMLRVEARLHANDERR
jgi:cellobiose epimerase